MRKERLQQLIDENFSIKEIAEIEGKGKTTVRYWLKKHKLKTKYGRKYTKEKLIPIVKNSRSYSEVLRKLGRNHSGGTWYRLKQLIQEYSIDTSHFLGRAACAGEFNTGKARKKIWQEILVEGYTKRAKTAQLNRALLESGREYCCEKCGNDGTWQNDKLTLHVDHINGDWSDCRKENLRFLCPNCHSQTPNFKNKGRVVE